jgi:hypothetical protein
MLMPLVLKKYLWKGKKYQLIQQFIFYKKIIQ